MLDVELSNVTLNYGFKNILDGATFRLTVVTKLLLLVITELEKLRFLNSLSLRKSLVVVLYPKEKMQLLDF